MVQSSEAGFGNLMPTWASPPVGRAEAGYVRPLGFVLGLWIFEEEGLADLHSVGQDHQKRRRC